MALLKQEEVWLQSLQFKKMGWAKVLPLKMVL
jgi:hypothetical protein